MFLIKSNNIIDMYRNII